MPPSKPPDNGPELPDKRSAAAERCNSVLGALWLSSFVRRRVGPRRSSDRHPVMTDWYQPHWLAIAMAILILSCLDALLTLELVSRGAREINPLMEPLVKGSGHSFALWKLGLTSMGVVVLTMIARFRILGRIAVGSVLYLILCSFLLLVGYEIALLRIDSGH